MLSAQETVVKFNDLVVFSHGWTVLNLTDIGYRGLQNKACLTEAINGCKGLSGPLFIAFIVIDMTVALQNQQSQNLAQAIMLPLGIYPPNQVWIGCC